MPGQQQLGLQSPRRCMQLVFSPHLPQRYAYYIVSQQGVQGMPEHYPGKDAAPPAAARVPGAAGWSQQAPPTAQQQQQQQRPAHHAPEGPQQQSAPQTHLTRPGQQQAPSMQGATGAAGGGLQARQHVLQQQSAQRPHGGLQHQQERAVPPSHPGHPMPDSTQPARLRAPSNEDMRQKRQGNSGQVTAQPPQIMSQRKQFATSAAMSTWPQHTAQQQQPGQCLSSRPQPPLVAASVGQNASQQQVLAGPGQRAPSFGVSYNTPPRPGVTGDWSPAGSLRMATSPVGEALL